MMFLRKTDYEGHIVVPAEIRKALQIKADELLVLSVDPSCQSIFLQKIKPVCCCCGAEQSLLKLPSQKFLCTNCYDSVKQKNC